MEDNLAGMQACRHAGMQACRHAGMQAGMQAGRQGLFIKLN